ncbi:TetR/AcrR family transcriptional regulator [Selenomonas caprae]|nr:MULTISPECIES: TetR/AcrR family transcriptional regulator [Selenomonas]TYZ31074.1 TetR/AcrR family transcriptional regulator [Selenomonas caprae]
MEEKMGRRERKKMLSRQAILAAAVEQFSHKGFKETSVADIMNAADLGIGTFYNYFQSKEEILVQLMQEMVREVATELKELRAQNRPARDLLEAGCRITAAFLDKNRYVLPLFLSAADHSGLPEGSDKQTKVLSPGFKVIFERILREGQEKGEVRSDVPAELIAEMFHSIYQAAAFSKLNISFQENVAMKTRLLLDGIRAECANV